MRERPILFSAPMVRAILEGRKTQTRRIMKPQPEEAFGVDYNANGTVRERRSYGWSWRKGTGWPHVDIFPGGDSLFRQFCPYGAPGDRLWVRETFAELSGVLWYRADENVGRGPWTPSIHMPRRASRINLEVTGVRVERLQDISDADARAEGIAHNWLGDLTKGPNGFGGEGWVEDCGWMNYETDEDGEPCYTAQESFRSLWRSINGAESWAANPWVWVVEFKRVTA